MSSKLVMASMMVVLFAGVASQAGEWSLPKMNGHVPNVWEGDGNWKEDCGNPMSDKGAKWGLYYQRDEGGNFEPMVYGLAYNYNYCWRSSEGHKMAGGHGEEPLVKYLENTLICPSGKVFPGDGPCALVTFKPDAAGTFNLELGGVVGVQAPSAGYAKLKVLVLDSAMKCVKEIKVLEIKAKEDFKIGEAIELKDGERIGVTIQSVNPGPSGPGCGWSSISVKKLTVSGK